MSLNLTTQIQNFKPPPFLLSHCHQLLLSRYCKVPCVSSFSSFSYCIATTMVRASFLPRSENFPFQASLKQYSRQSLAINWSENSSAAEALTISPQPSLNLNFVSALVPVSPDKQVCFAVPASALALQNLLHCYRNPLLPASQDLG